MNGDFYDMTMTNLFYIGTPARIGCNRVIYIALYIYNKSILYLYCVSMIKIYVHVPGISN